MFVLKCQVFIQPSTLAQKYLPVQLGEINKIIFRSRRSEQVLPPCPYRSQRGRRPNFWRLFAIRTLSIVKTAEFCQEKGLNQELSHLNCRVTAMLSVQLSQFGSSTFSRWCWNTCWARVLTLTRAKRAVGVELSLDPEGRKRLLVRGSWFA